MQKFFLMHMALDLSIVLPYRQFVFTYKGTSFKFVSTFSNLYSECLSTIVEDTDMARGQALKLARQWAMGLSFDAPGYCSVTYVGGPLAKAGLTLEKSQDMHLAFRSIAMARMELGHDAHSIVNIVDDDQTRALQIYNLGRCALDIYSEFNYYWQVLEVKNLGMKASQWIDGLPTNALSMVKSEIHRLPLGTQSLGNYMYDDCRNAIAHLRRWSKGYVTIDFDNFADIQRIQTSLRVIRHLAEHYLKTVLNLEDRRFLYSVRGERYPIYLTRDEAADRRAVHSRGLKRTKLVDSMIIRMQRGLDCGFKHPTARRKKRKV